MEIFRLAIFFFPLLVIWRQKRNMANEKPKSKQTKLFSHTHTHTFSISFTIFFLYFADKIFSIQVFLFYVYFFYLFSLFLMLWKNNSFDFSFGFIFLLFYYKILHLKFFLFSLSLSRTLFLSGKISSFFLFGFIQFSLILPFNIKILCFIQFILLYYFPQHITIHQIMFFFFLILISRNFHVEFCTHFSYLL